MERVVIDLDGAEAVTDEPERTVLLLAAHPLADITWSRYEAGESGPDPHVHCGHTDGFVVLGGELEFLLGPEHEPVCAPAGTLVLVPPGVIHTFRNASGATATFLNVHAPSGGFAAQLRGETDDWDEHEPPADGGRDPADVLLRVPAEESAAATDTLSLELTSLPPLTDGAGLRSAEGVAAAFVLGGLLAVRIGDEVRQAQPGELSFAPPGTPYAFSNPGDGRTRALLVAATPPAG